MVELPRRLRQGRVIAQVMTFASGEGGPRPPRPTLARNRQHTGPPRRVPGLARRLFGYGSDATVLPVVSSPREDRPRVGTGQWTRRYHPGDCRAVRFRHGAAHETLWTVELSVRPARPPLRPPDLPPFGGRFAPGWPPSPATNRRERLTVVIGRARASPRCLRPPRAVAAWATGRGFGMRRGQRRPGRERGAGPQGRRSR
jgi:hypothetical protein